MYVSLNIRYIRILLYLGIALAWIPAEAAIQEDGLVTRVLLDINILIGNGAAGLDLHGKMLNTFVLLATLELFFSLAFEVIKGGSLESLFTILVQRIMFIGIMYWLYDQGLVFAGLILQTMLDLGNGYHSVAVMWPGAVLEFGIEMVTGAFRSFSFTDPAVSLGAIMLALVVLICSAWIAGVFAVALVEFWFLSNMGVFLLGFGGNSITKDYAISYFKMCLILGAKIFILLALSEIMKTFYEGFAADINTADISQWIVMAGVSVMFGILSGRVPELLGALMQGGMGFSLNNGRGAGSAIGATASAVGGAAVGVSSTIAAGSAAAKLGKSQSGNSTLNSISEFGKAAGSDMAGRASGQIHSMKGMTMGGRMATAMKGKQTIAPAAATPAPTEGKK